MHLSTGERIASLTHVQKGKGAAVGQTQGDIQIPQPHVAVDAQHPRIGRGQRCGNPGADRGFSRSALAGQNRDQFAHAQTPPTKML